MTKIQIKPNFKSERQYLKKFQTIAGVDEAGVGPLAGPVVAAAVVLDKRKIGLRRTRNNWWNSVRDSKQLSHEKRETLIRSIFQNSMAFGIGSASVEEIDKMNILQARLLAMRRAVESLKVRPEFLLVDGNVSIPGVSLEQECVIDGDAKILSVACASIVAKVTRDNILNRLHKNYPEYGFDKHKGYPTKLHKERLKQFGPCAVHRKSFAPVKNLLEQDQTPYGRIDPAQLSITVEI